MRVFLAIVAMLFFATSVTAEDMSTVNYSTDNKLLSEVKTRMILENGLVIHAWEWNDTATALDAKYGAAAEDGGYVPAGLIAQDVQAVYPDAVFEDANGFLTIDLPVLADQDEVIAKMVMQGTADKVSWNCKWLPHDHRDCSKNQWSCGPDLRKTVKHRHNPYDYQRWMHHVCQKHN